MESLVFLLGNLHPTLETKWKVTDRTLRLSQASKESETNIKSEPGNIYST
jgi:hypothetical protein